MKSRLFRSRETQKTQHIQDSGLFIFCMNNFRSLFFCDVLSEKCINVFHCYKCCLWTCQTWYRKRATGRNRVLLLASRASSSFLFPSSPCHSIFFSKTIPKSPNKTLETNTIFPVKITLCTLHYFRREDDVSHTLRHFMGTKILLTRRDQTEINQIEWETIANVFLQLKQFHSGWNNSKWAHFVFLKRA